MITWAPFCTNISTISVCPFLAAHVNGVMFLRLHVQ